jgi:RNA polymerase sigma factor (sigma-70 family)
MLAELPLIFRSIVRRQVPAQDALDLCQDLIRIALERLDAAEEAGIDVCPWLWGIARNIVAQYRQRGRRSDSTEGDEEKLLQLSHPTSTPEVRTESRETLYMLLEKVHPSRREIFLAHWLDGLTFDQISQAFDISPEAARKRTERAMREFVQAWAEHQAAQRKLGLFVLPIAAFALLEAERLYCAHMAEAALETLRERIEPLLRGDDAPVSQTMASRDHGAPDAVDALVADPSSLAPWFGSFGALVVGVLLAISLLARDTSSPSVITPEPVAVAAHEALPDVVPIDSTNSSTTPANNPAPPPVAHVAKPPVSRAVEPAAYILLRLAQRYANRGDIGRARAGLAAYDAAYPRNPLPVARARLTRRLTGGTDSPPAR